MEVTLTVMLPGVLAARDDWTWKVKLSAVLFDQPSTHTSREGRVCGTERMAAPRRPPTFSYSWREAAGEGREEMMHVTGCKGELPVQPLAMEE